MASLATAINERRHEPRVACGGHRFGAEAVLRPGQAVVLVNLSRRGALVSSAARLRPGATAELLLCGPDVRLRVEGRLEHCQVVSLNPLRYRGVVVFDEEVDIGAGAGAGGSE